MAGKIIFAAHLPLPTSVNSLYSYNERTGKKHLSASARAYIEDVQNILAYYEKAKNKQEFAPHHILYADYKEIEAIRALYANKSKARAVLEQRKWYRVDSLKVLNRDMGDLDNLAKLEQDVITKYLGFDDKRVVELHPKRIVNKEAVPHSEIVVRETDIDWGDGDLMRLAELELSVDRFYDYAYETVENSEIA